MLDVDQILLFAKILQGLHQQTDDQAIYRFVLDEVMKVTRTSAGTLFVADPKAASLIPVAAVGSSADKLKSLPFKFGLGICGWVAQNCEAVIINDPRTDQRFTHLYDKATGFKTQNILCAPLVAHDECIGVVEVINRTDRPFLDDDLVFLNLLGGHMAVALENAILYKKVNQLDIFSFGIINSLASGIAAVDNGGIVVLCNPNAQRILRLEWSVVGSPCDNAFKKTPAFLGVLQAALNGNAALVGQELTLPFEPDPARIGYSTFPVRSQGGQNLGAGILFQDITAYQKPQRG